jgi:transcriptional regulator with XRE-family HTH domain
MDGQDKDLHFVFGKVLKILRTQRGLSQEQLGFECDLDRTFISLMERGLRQPTLTTLFTLAEHLDVSVAHLMNQVEEQRAQYTVKAGGDTGSPTE